MFYWWPPDKALVCVPCFYKPDFHFMQSVCEPLSLPQHTVEFPIYFKHINETSSSHEAFFPITIHQNNIINSNLNSHYTVFPLKS